MGFDVKFSQDSGQKHGIVPACQRDGEEFLFNSPQQLRLLLALWLKPRVNYRLKRLAAGVKLPFVAIWKLISDSFSFRNRWIEVHAADYQTAAGKYSYSFVSRTRKGVVIMPYFSDTDSFLLVSQFRPPIGKTIWQFPAGLVETRDSLPAAAQRELGEETGYQAGKLIRLGLVHPDPGIISGPGYFFLAVNPVRGSTRKIGENEPISRIKKFKIRQLEKMIVEAKIRDGWTLSGLMLYKLWKTNAKN